MLINACTASFIKRVLNILFHAQHDNVIKNFLSCGAQTNNGVACEMSIQSVEAV